MNRLPREDVEVPSLKMFKARLGGAYGHPVHRRELELDSPYDFFFFFQPKPFCYSMFCDFKREVFQEANLKFELSE